MRILFVTAHAHLPEMAGGSQSSTHEMALHLARAGHEVAALASLWGRGYVGLRGRILMKLLRRSAVKDRLLGYDVYRKWCVWQDVEAVTSDFRPDVAVVMAMKPVPAARALLAAGIPTIVYFRDVEFDTLAGDPRDLHGALFIANSHFTAQRYRDAFGLDCTVVPPLFDANRYRAPRAEDACVTFVNPSPAKGRDLAFEIAALCPEIPFQFLESWPLEASEREAVETRCRGTNITFVPCTDDMRGIFARTRILLAPSQWEEAWGRVATEAQFSGIPVLASDIGGLPEAVGPGGILLAPDAPADEWARVLTRLWSDGALHEEMSRSALSHAGRPELDPDHQAAQLLRLFREAAEAAASAGDGPADGVSAGTRPKSKVRYGTRRSPAGAPARRLGRRLARRFARRFAKRPVGRSVSRPSSPPA